MDYPAEFDEVMERALEAHPTAETQIDCVERELRKLPSFQDYADRLIRLGIARLVYAYRDSYFDRQRQRELRYRDARERLIPSQKVRGAGSKVVQNEYAKYFRYCVDGRFLGDFKGKELGAAILKVRAIKDGHAKTEALLVALQGIVPDEATIGASVEGPKLQRLFRKVGLEKAARAAAA